MEHIRAGYRVQLTVLSLVSVLQVCCAARDLPFDYAALPNWNYSGMNASLFRSDNIVRYFDVWPENATGGARFAYYCEDPATMTQSLRNYTYNLSGGGVDVGGRLDPRPYYDLGVVDNFAQPYWKHWLFWTVDTRPYITYRINCEYHDLHALYTYRFWHKPVFQGFRAFLVMQAVVMGTVFIAMALRWHKEWRNLEWRNLEWRNLEWRNLKWGKAQCYFRPWSRDWGQFFSELLHLGLVVEMGYCMMEAVGHSDLRSWRAMIMYNAGVVYTWLTLFAVLSSIIRQTTNGWEAKPETTHDSHITLASIIRQTTNGWEAKPETTHDSHITLASIITQIINGWPTHETSEEFDHKEKLYFKSEDMASLIREVTNGLPAKIIIDHKEAPYIKPEVMLSIIRQISIGWPDELYEKNNVKSSIERPTKTRIEKSLYSIQACSDDWRWQRVFAQLGAFILMGTYLTFVEDPDGTGMDQLAGLVLAAVVVACIWSFGVPAVVLFRFIRTLVFASLYFYKLAREKDKESRKDQPVLPTAKEGIKRKFSPSKTLRRQIVQQADQGSSSEFGRLPYTPSPRHRVHPHPQP